MVERRRIRAFVPLVGATLGVVVGSGVALALAPLVHEARAARSQSLLADAGLVAPTPSPSPTAATSHPTPAPVRSGPPPSCALTPVDAPWLAVAPRTPPTLPQTPKSLEPRVTFWRRVWEDTSERQTLIVDDRRPWIVFADVDCADLFQWGEPAFAQARCGERVTAAMKKATTTMKTGWWRPENLRRYAGNKKLARTAYKNLIGVRGRKEALERARERARHQLDHAEGLFALEGVPRLYARAAIVESLWRPEALSKRGAVGAFQFMPLTSKMFLHVTDGVVDERLDPVRSSWAAARYLKKMHAQLKSWPLTLTAYNTGPARMRRVMRLRKTYDLGHIANAGDIGEYGFDGQNYYAQIVAIARITKDDDLPVHVPTGRTLRVERPASLDDLAACTSSTPPELIAANPALLEPVRSGVVPVPAGYVLYVPDRGAVTALRMTSTSTLASIHR